jgi:hypothetical protein
VELVWALVVVVVELVCEVQRVEMAEGLPSTSSSAT